MSCVFVNGRGRGRSGGVIKVFGGVGEGED